MKNAERIKSITYAGLMISISLVFLGFARFFQVIDLTILFIIASAVCFPLCEKRYFSAIVSYIVVATVSPFITGKPLLSFLYIIWLGPASIAMIIWDKTKYKKYLGIFIALVINNIAFWALYGIIKKFFLKDFYATTEIIKRIEERTNKVGFIFTLMFIWNVFTFITNYAILFFHRFLDYEIFTKRLQRSKEVKEKTQVFQDEDF